jgi:hypothetical protein
MFFLKRRIVRSDTETTSARPVTAMQASGQAIVDDARSHLQDAAHVDSRDEIFTVLE